LQCMKEDKKKKVTAKHRKCGEPFSRKK